MPYEIVTDKITIDLPMGTGHNSASGPIIYAGVLDEKTGNIYNISDKLNFQIEYSPTDSTNFLAVQIDDDYSTNPETAHALVLNTANPTTFPERITKVYLKDDKGNYADGFIEIITHEYVETPEPDTTTKKIRFLFDPTDFIKDNYYYLFVVAGNTSTMVSSNNVIDSSKTLMEMSNTYSTLFGEAAIQYNNSISQIKTNGANLSYTNGNLFVDLNTCCICPAISTGPNKPGITGGFSSYTYKQIQDNYIYVFSFPTSNSKYNAAVACTIPIKDMAYEPDTDRNHFTYFAGGYN